MCKNSFSCDTVAMKRFFKLLTSHVIHDLLLAPIWLQLHVVTWDVMIIIKSLSQVQNAFASLDGMVMHVTKIHALQNHAKMLEFAQERSQI